MSETYWRELLPEEIIREGDQWYTHGLSRWCSPADGFLGETADRTQVRRPIRHECAPVGYRWADAGEVAGDAMRMGTVQGTALWHTLDKDSTRSHGAFLMPWPEDPR